MVQRNLSSTAPLEDRIRLAAAALRSALAPVVSRVAEPNVRPIALARRLSLDDSLTARLLRALRASDSLATAREIPAPQGLRMFLAAAERAGVATDVRVPAEEAIVQFERLLEEFPSGRAGLDTTIENWLPEVRRRRERAATQAIYKSTAQMLGYSVDTMVNVTAIQPSADGRMCDALNIFGKVGVRRLRAGSPILVIGALMTPVDADQAGDQEALSQVKETIRGEREALDPRKFILTDFCDPPDIPLRLIQRGNFVRFVLDQSSPPLNTPVTIFAADITRNAYLRYRSGDRVEDGTVALPRIPCRALVLDVLLRDDVYPGVTPEIVPRLHGLVIDANQRDEDLIALDRVDLGIAYERLGIGLDRTGLRWLPAYPALLRNVLASAGWDPQRFRVFRCTVVYPMPFVSLNTWFPLPPAPG